MTRGFSSKQVIKLLERKGFVLRSVKGSHHKYKKGSRRVIVPHPKKDLRYGTLGSILDQAGLSIKDLES